MKRHLRKFAALQPKRSVSSGSVSRQPATRENVKNTTTQTTTRENVKNTTATQANVEAAMTTQIGRQNIGVLQESKGVDVIEAAGRSKTSLMKRDAMGKPENTITKKGLTAQNAILQGEIKITQGDNHIDEVKIPEHEDNKSEDSEASSRNTLAAQESRCDEFPTPDPRRIADNNVAMTPLPIELVNQASHPDSGRLVEPKASYQPEYLEVGQPQVNQAASLGEGEQTEEVTKHVTKQMEADAPLGPPTAIASLPSPFTMFLDSDIMGVVGYTNGMTNVNATDNAITSNTGMRKTQRITQRTLPSLYTLVSDLEKVSLVGGEYKARSRKVAEFLKVQQLEQRHPDSLLRTLESLLGREKIRKETLIDLRSAFHIAVREAFNLSKGDTRDVKKLSADGAATFASVVENVLKEDKSTNLFTTIGSYQVGGSSSSSTQLEEKTKEPQTPKKRGPPFKPKKDYKKIEPLTPVTGDLFRDIDRFFRAVEQYSEAADEQSKVSAKDRVLGGVMTRDDFIDRATRTHMDILRFQISDEIVRNEAIIRGSKKTSTPWEVAETTKPSVRSDITDTRATKHSTPSKFEKMDSIFNQFLVLQNLCTGRKVLPEKTLLESVVIDWMRKVVTTHGDVRSSSGNVASIVAPIFQSTANPDNHASVVVGTDTTAVAQAAGMMASAEVPNTTTATTEVTTASANEGEGQQRNAVTAFLLGQGTPESLEAVKPSLEPKTDLNSTAVAPFQMMEVINAFFRGQGTPESLEAVKPSREPESNVEQNLAINSEQNLPMNSECNSNKSEFNSSITNSEFVFSIGKTVPHVCEATDIFNAKTGKNVVNAGEIGRDVVDARETTYVVTEGPAVASLSTTKNEETTGIATTSLAPANEHFGEDFGIMLDSKETKAITSSINQVYKQTLDIWQVAGDSLPSILKVLETNLSISKSCIEAVEQSAKKSAGCVEETKESRGTKSDSLLIKNINSITDSTCRALKVLQKTSLRPGSFVQPMQAERRLVDLDSLKKYQSMEYKYDGFRAQVHLNLTTDVLKCFSRDGMVLDVSSGTGSTVSQGSVQHGALQGDVLDRFKEEIMLRNLVSYYTGNADKPNLAEKSKKTKANASPAKGKTTTLKGKTTKTATSASTMSTMIIPPSEAVKRVYIEGGETELGTYSILVGSPAMPTAKVNAAANSTALSSKVDTTKFNSTRSVKQTEEALDKKLKLANTHPIHQEIPIDCVDRNLAKIDDKVADLGEKIEIMEETLLEQTAARETRKNKTLVNQNLPKPIFSCILDAELVAYDLKKNQILPFSEIAKKSDVVSEKCKKEEIPPPGSDQNHSSFPRSTTTEVTQTPTKKTPREASKKFKKDVDNVEPKRDFLLYAFDILYLNGETLTDLPFRERRDILHQYFYGFDSSVRLAKYKDLDPKYLETKETDIITKETDIPKASKTNILVKASTKTLTKISEKKLASQAKKDKKLEESIRSFAIRALKSNCEGLMLKTLDDTYEPGERRLRWRKLKNVTKIIGNVKDDKDGKERMSSKTRTASENAVKAQRKREEKDMTSASRSQKKPSSSEIFAEKETAGTTQSTTQKAISDKDNSATAMHDTKKKEVATGSLMKQEVPTAKPETAKKTVETGGTAVVKDKRFKFSATVSDAKSSANKKPDVEKDKEKGKGYSTNSGVSAGDDKNISVIDKEFSSTKNISVFTFNGNENTSDSSSNTSDSSDLNTSDSPDLNTSDSNLNTSDTNSNTFDSNTLDLNSNLDSLDLVPIGAWYSNKYTRPYYGSFLMAAWDPDTQKYHTVCKLGTGFDHDFLRDQYFRKNNSDVEAFSLATMIDPKIGSYFNNHDEATNAEAINVEASNASGNIANAPLGNYSSRDCPKNVDYSRAEDGNYRERAQTFSGETTLQGSKKLSNTMHTPTKADLRPNSTSFLQTINRVRGNVENVVGEKTKDFGDLNAVHSETIGDSEKTETPVVKMVRKKDKTGSKFSPNKSAISEKDIKQQMRKLEGCKPDPRFVIPKGMRPDVYLDGSQVWEVAGDELTNSKTHSLGISLRFPRFVRARTDLSPQTATTSKDIKQLAGNKLYAW